MNDSDELLETLTQVNEFLQVPGLSNIFAVGDCCNTDEHKMAAFAGAHGDTVAKNILQDLMGGPPSPYKRVTQSPHKSQEVTCHLLIAAFRGDVGSVRAECRGWDVQRVPHPELRGGEAQVRGTLH